MDASSEHSSEVLRLTNPQRALLTRLATEGDLCIKGSADRRVIWSLSRYGLVRSIDGHWYAITAIGREMCK